MPKGGNSFLSVVPWGALRAGALPEKGACVRFHHGLWGSLSRRGMGPGAAKGRLLVLFLCEGGMLARETPPDGVGTLGVLSRGPVPGSGLP